RLRMRRAHRALHRGQEPHRADRARGDHQQDQRRPAVLRYAARPGPGGSGRADRQRLRQGSAAAAADGVRRRGAEAARDQPRGERGVMTKRTIGIIGALWVVFAPLTAFWLMWSFAFRTLT